MVVQLVEVVEFLLEEFLLVELEEFLLVEVLLVEVQLVEVPGREVVEVEQQLALRRQELSRESLVELNYFEVI